MRDHGLRPSLGRSRYIRQRRAIAASPVLVLLNVVYFAGNASAACPNRCSGHGDCVSARARCACHEGWDGYDCSLRLCPLGNKWTGFPTAVDTVHEDQAECSNKGTCDRSTGICDCLPGFEGLACERMSCPGSSSAPCSGNGRCLTLREAGAERNGISLTRQFRYDDPWDADMIRGCVCDLGFEGYDCSQRVCPRGDDPMTGGQVDEVQLIHCSCPGTNCTGYLHLTFGGEVTARISHQAVPARGNESGATNELGLGLGESTESKLEELASIEGVIVRPGTNDSEYSNDTQAEGGHPATALCLPESQGGAITRIIFNERGGDVPALEVTSQINGLDAAGSDAGNGTVFVEHSGQGTSVDGTTEFIDCSGRGLCNRDSGLCNCFSGYASSDGDGNPGPRGDCGYAYGAIDDCPNSLSRCSGRGECDNTRVVANQLAVVDNTVAGFENTTFEYMCGCFPGFTGADCSERECPRGYAWFDEPFAENRAHAETECSNRGICNRDSGTCACQPGFTGSACQRLSCPLGNNGDTCSGRGRCLTLRELAPLSTRQGYPLGGVEVQRINCSLDQHNFTIQLNHHRTFPISWDASEIEVRDALEVLPTAGLVEVSFDPGPTACHGSGNEIIVRFPANLGDVPEMSGFATTPTGVGSVEVATEQDGSRLSYGLTDGDLDTWDADQIHACYCDGGIEYNKTLPADTEYSYESTGGRHYVGYQGGGVSTEPDPREFMGLACELRPCPVGVDPLSSTELLEAARERQVISCSESPLNMTSAGEPALLVRLQHMGQSTPEFGPNATAAHVRDLLLALDSTGLLNVTINSTAATEARAQINATNVASGVTMTSEEVEALVLEQVSWCELNETVPDAGAELSVEFLTELQDLPQMRLEVLRGSSRKVSVATAEDGAGAAIECSGRGTCDASSGLCTCFSGYVSGNGRGQKGGRGDCGAQDIHYIRPGDETYAPTVLQNRASISARARDAALPTRT